MIEFPSQTAPDTVSGSQLRLGGSKRCEGRPAVILRDFFFRLLGGDPRIPHEPPLSGCRKMQERRARTVGVRVTAAEAAELRALGQRVQRRLGAADAGVEPDRGESESNGAGAQLGAFTGRSG